MYPFYCFSCCFVSHVSEGKEEVGGRKCQIGAGKMVDGSNTVVEQLTEYHLALLGLPQRMTWLISSSYKWELKCIGRVRREEKEEQSVIPV